MQIDFINSMIPFDDIMTSRVNPFICKEVGVKPVFFILGFTHFEYFTEILQVDVSLFSMIRHLSKNLFFISVFIYFWMSFPA